jgi:hypothetical protein
MPQEEQTEFVHLNSSRVYLANRILKKEEIEDLQKESIETLDNEFLYIKTITLSE